MVISELMSRGMTQVNHLVYVARISCRINRI